MENKKSLSPLDLAHEFWLVYSDLEDVEALPECGELLCSARHRLGELVNVLTHRAVATSEESRA